jgi:hypothetical protein
VRSRREVFSKESEESAASMSGDVCATASVKLCVHLCGSASEHLMPAPGLKQPVSLRMVHLRMVYARWRDDMVPPHGGGSRHHRERHGAGVVCLVTPLTRLLFPAIGRCRALADGRRDPRHLVSGEQRVRRRAPRSPCKALIPEVHGSAVCQRTTYQNAVCQSRPSVDGPTG